MLVKVHTTEQGDLIRDTDGKQIGKIFVPVLYRAEESIYKVDGKTVIPKYGYIGEDGEFHELCTAIGCSSECLNKNKPNCRYCLKGGVQSMYIEVQE